MKVGDKVIIRECHKIPELVGKEATIIAELSPDVSKYPYQVVLTGEKLSFSHPMLGQGQTSGPFAFREEELELATPEPVPIPDVFLKMDE